MTFKGKEAELTKFIELYDMPEEERKGIGITSFQKLCQVVGISEPTGYKWQKKIKAQRGIVTDAEKDDFNAHLKKLAFSKQGKSKDRELYARMNGWLVDKREDIVRFEPSPADQIAWGNKLLESLRNSFREHSGICPVCGGHQILRPEIRVDTEQEHGEESKMELLAVSSETA